MTSPLAFALVFESIIKGAMKEFDENTQLLAYADDLVLISSDASNSLTAARTLEEELRNCGFKFNLKKTQYQIQTTAPDNNYQDLKKKYLEQIQSEFYSKAEMAEVKDEIVYLGARIYRDNRLSLRELTKEGKLYKIRKFKKTLRSMHQDV